jgi:hypothetical protein
MCLVPISSPSSAFVEKNVNFFVDKNVNCEKCEIEARRERISFFRQFPGRDAASPKRAADLLFRFCGVQVGGGNRPCQK